MTNPNQPSQSEVRGPVAVDDVAWKHWGEAQTRFAGRSRHLTKEWGDDYHVAVVIEELPPGGQSCPAHYHLHEEEHVWVLEGSVTLRLGERTYQMNPGDLVLLARRIDPPLACSSAPWRPRANSKYREYSFVRARLPRSRSPARSTGQSTSRAAPVCFPAGQRAGHCLVHHTDKPCRDLLIGERNPNEVAVYTDSNKILVRALKEIYDKSATKRYLDGEDVDLD